MVFAVLWLVTPTAAQAQESEPDDAEPAEADLQEEASAEAEEGFESHHEPYLNQEVAAKANGQSGEEPVDAGHSIAEVAIDLGFYFRNHHLGSKFDLSPILSGWLAIADDWDLTLQWGFAYNSVSADDDETAGAFVIGNPSITVRRVLQEGRTRIWFGIGAVAPVSSVPDKDESEYGEKVDAYLTASAIRGNWNHFLWMPEHFGMVLPVGAHMVSEDHILLGGEAAFYYLMPVDNYHARQQDFYIQVAGDIGFGWESVQTGVRLQGVVVTTNLQVDRLQGAVVPFVHYDLGGGQLNARFLLNLDDPNGVFGKNDVWGLYLGCGATFQ